MSVALVTGSNGFLGRAIASALLSEGVHVRGVGRNTIPFDNRVEHIQVDLARKTPSSEILEEVDTVFNCAAVLPSQQDDLAKNVLMTQNLLKSMEQTTATLVHVSSASVYGSRPGKRTETDDLNPDNDYGRCKLMCEQVIKEQVDSALIPGATILRLANVFGPEMPKSNNLMRLADAIGKRRFVGLGEGTNRKSLLHIEDAVTACLVSTGKFEGSRTLNVATGDLSMNEITNTVAHALGMRSQRWARRVSPQHVSSLMGMFPVGPAQDLSRGVGAFGSNDVLDCSSMAKQGFRPPKPLDERISDTFATTAESNFR